ncbi:MAG: phenylalanine--tRNA ligase subunit beta, partial [Gammaproteobacteria bacterium]|nr:phenylalanine--tRNA ligase subunit beta [Gammaproteobacteria bacterium]
ALAGIMGGLASGVTASSEDIFLESAFFVPHKLAGQARRYGLHSDSSHRFERGVDPELQRAAMERATALLLEIVGGEAGPIIEVLESAAMPKKSAIVLRAERIKRVLGLDLAAADVEEMLTCLGLQLEPVAGGWSIQPPSYRFDMNIEADLVEELARIYGYDRIPRTQPSLRPQMKVNPEASVGLEQLQNTLVDRGYQEVVCYTFCDPDLQALVEPDKTPLPLANPLSADLAVMRTTLFSGLLKTLQYNLNRQQSRVRLFESGLKFVQTEDGLEQTRCLAGLISGPMVTEQWGESDRKVDFFDLKGDLEVLLGRSAEQIEYRVEEHPTLHPGQSARLYKNDRPLGWIGALHPRLEKALGLSQTALLFELELDLLLEGALPKFAPLSRFPSIRRDLALVVDESVSMAQVSACVHEVAPSYLIELCLFDLYRGKGIETGRKSLALGLILQELSRTLKEDDVEESVAKILAHLQENLGATLRE